MSSYVLIPPFIIATLVAALSRRPWLIALALATCFAIKIIAPAPPPEDYAGKGVEAIPHHIIIDTTPEQHLPPIVIKPYHDPNDDDE